MYLISTWINNVLLRSILSEIANCILAHWSHKSLHLQDDDEFFTAGSTLEKIQLKTVNAVWEWSREDINKATLLAKDTLTEMFSDAKKMFSR